MMLDEAVARGASLMPGRATAAIKDEQGAVRGVQVRMPDGKIQDIESELMLDCSGQATWLANHGGVTGPKYSVSMTNKSPFSPRLPTLRAITVARAKLTRITL